jgi:hypothetical protein
VAWGVVAVLLIVLWVRSYWWSDTFEAPYFCFDSIGGQCSVEFKNTPRTSWSRRATPIGIWIDAPSLSDFSIVVRRSVYMAAPHWFFILLSTTLASLPWIRWSNRFSLRTLLIATTLIALVLGLIVWLS